MVTSFSMGLPKIAIVGRPNVGKSALFNRIVGKRIAIVDEAEGVTRDRLYGTSDLFGRDFEVIDTGGIDARSGALFNDEVKRQAEVAIEEGDGLIMVVDAHIGMTDLDLELSRILKRKKKPLVLAINKVDNAQMEDLVHQFHGLGIETMIPVSAIQGRYIAELLEPVVSAIPEGEIEEDDAIKVAIVGRPNVGKSTLVNTLLDEERCIVSPIAGTTRDSIDTHLDGMTLIDTAGIRRKKSEHEVVDKFAYIRTERAIERADICVLMLDSEQGMTTQDKKIANQIEEAGKACILLFNKWDLMKNVRMEHCLHDLRKEERFLAYCPVLFGSANTGRNVEKLIDLVKEVAEEQKKRISTSRLNKFIIEAMQANHPPMMNAKRLRIYYMTQIGQGRFLLFVNYPDLMAKSYQRYIYNRFREAFGFKGCPITFELRQRARRPEGQKAPKDLLLEALDRSLQPTEA